jgi:hypothetical protein
MQWQRLGRRLDCIAFAFFLGVYLVVFLALLSYMAKCSGAEEACRSLGALEFQQSHHNH